VPVKATIGPPWYESDWFTKPIIYGFALLVVVKFFHSVFLKENDFDWHLAYGHSVLKATYFGDSEAFRSLIFHYPPGRMLIDEAVALLPRLAARAIFFCAAIGSLFITQRIWRELAQKVTPASSGVEFAAAALAFLLFANWVVRDFDECGLQILLLLFLSMAVWSLFRGARIQTGAWLGLAITFKLTPVLFVPLLIWKRHFVEAGATICFVVVFNALLPGLIWGPNLARDVLLRHIETLKMAATLDDPSENGIERPSHRSQSLKLAIARYLQTYPPGHPLFIDRDYDELGCTERGIDPTSCHRHPLFIQFLNLPRATAKQIVTILIVIIALVLAWRLRPKWGLEGTKNDAKNLSSLAPEWAVACAFAAIVSPITWHQHLTLVLPCGYLVIRDALIRADHSWIRSVGLGFIIVSVWILHRDPLSKLHSLIAMSYHFEVVAVLILIVLTLTIEGAIKRSRPKLSEGNAVRQA
jgi:glycosyl transferase family 87